MPNKETRLRLKLAEMEEIKKNAGKTSIIDASGAVAGRLASVVAKRLLRGESIVILNSEHAVVTGSEETVKARYLFKTTVGTRRKGPFPSRMPHFMLKRTVRGMMQYQRPNGRAALKRLMCHIGVPPEFVGKKAETVPEAVREVRAGMTLGQISNYLGKDFQVQVKKHGT